VNSGTQKIPILVGVEFSGVELLTELITRYTDCHIFVPHHHCFQLFTGALPCSEPSFADLLRILLDDFTEANDLEFVREISLVEQRFDWNATMLLQAFFQLLALKHGKNRFGIAAPSDCCPAAASEIMPGSHFVHLVRDGREVSARIMNRHFITCRDATDLWLQYVDTFYKQEQWENATSIRYEDLIAAPIEITKFLCDTFDLCNLLPEAPIETDLLQFERPDELVDLISPCLSKSERKEIEQRAAIALDQYRYLPFKAEASAENEL
jgi:hypothetical protein